MIDDLRLGDIFVFEYNIITTFDEAHFLDKRYFRFVLTLPSTYWFYQDFLFRVIQERPEDLQIRERFFATSPDATEKPPTLLSKGGVYTFARTKFQPEEPEQRYSPIIEIATATTWEAISNYLCSLYQQTRLDLQPEESTLYKQLPLQTDSQDKEEQIQKIIEYVQNQVVYLYDAEFMHGHVPQSTDKTLLSKSGDCKAKSLLLIRLLKTIDVPATFVLVNYQSDLFLKTCAPSPFVFDHAIVKVTYQDQDFFVDPTSTGASGILPARTEPYFSYYLPIEEEAKLMHKSKRRVTEDYNIEEEMHIRLQPSEGTLHSTTLYRRDSADIVRKNFRMLPEAQFLREEMKMLQRTLTYAEETPVEDLFKDMQRTVLLDDLKNNLLKIETRVTLLKPYHSVNTETIFRYYHDLSIEGIKNFRHKDHLCDSFCGFPAKYQLTVESDLFIDKRNNLTTKETTIENDYFSFSNTKKISWKRAVINLSYKPKRYDYIAPEDLETLKKDYARLDDSNFGIGIVFVSLPQFLRRHFYLTGIGLVILINIIRHILQAIF